MKFENAKIGTMVSVRGGIDEKSGLNYIGYIYKTDEKDKTVKVNWSISLSEWENCEDLIEIQMDNWIEFVEGYTETIKNEDTKKLFNIVFEAK